MRVFCFVFLALQHCATPLCSDEVSKAQTATKTAEPTIFSKILNRIIPAHILYEDEKVIVSSCYTMDATNTCSVHCTKHYFLMRNKITLH